MDKVKYFLGIDLHKHFIQVCVINQEGEKVEEMRLPTIKELIKEKLSKYSGVSKSVVEATFNWYWLIDLLEEMNLSPSLAHTRKLKIISQSAIKTDKVDAQKLAHLLRLNFIPSSYIPPKLIREIKELIRSRNHFVKIKTSLKNRIHSLLDKLGIKHNFTDLFSVSGLRFLNNLSLGENFDKALKIQLKAIEDTQEKIKKIEANLFSYCEHPDFKEKIELLRTIPGIEKLGALILLVEIVNIDRFKNHKKLASYAGLTPRIKESADKTIYGRINKESNSNTRTVLIEAVPHIIRHDANLYRYYRKVLIKKGVGKAKVAVCRKVLIKLYYMLKEGKKYWEISEVEPSVQSGKVVYASN